MNNINPFLNKLILQISLIWFDKANPNKANNLQIDPNLPATLAPIIRHSIAGNDSDEYKSR